MGFKFNPLGPPFDIDNDSGGTSSTSIPEYTSDPGSPAARDAWVLRSGSASGGGDLMMLIGGFPLTTPGSSTYTYTFKYRTDEATTVSVALT